MSILSDTMEIISDLGIPVETGVFKNEAPEIYIVLVPLSDTYPLSADNRPEVDCQELRISLFSKENYIKNKNRILKALIDKEFYITERRYNGYDTVSGYHQYSIDIANNYLLEEEN